MAIKKKRKKLPHTDYEGRFQHIKHGKIIKSKDGTRKLKFDKADDWRQCYLEDNEIRKGYPKHWFINSDGELITMYYAEPRLLSYTMNSQGYIRYSTKTKHHDRHTRFFAHQMIAEIFGSYEYTDKNAKDVEVHHEKGKDNNNTNVLEYVSSQIHSKIHHITSRNFDKLEKISSICEGITEPSIITTGINIKIGRDNGDRAIFKLKDIDLTFKKYKPTATEQMANIISDDIINNRIPKEDCLITVHEGDIQFAYTVTHCKDGNCKFSIIPVPEEQIFVLTRQQSKENTEREDIKHEEN